MEHINIGMSVLQKYADYAKQNSLDDESEYFPTIKVIIKGIIESFEGPKSEKDSLECTLIEYMRQKYVADWIEYAKEDDENPNLEKETKDALKQFNKLCFKKGS